MARGDKQGTSVKIMCEYGPGHDAHEVTRRIREACTDLNRQFGVMDDVDPTKVKEFTENQARSMYTWIFKERRKLLPENWTISKFSRAPRTKKEETGTTMDASTEKRGTPERLETIKSVAARLKAKRDPKAATAEIEALAAAGAHLQYAETETPHNAEAT